MKRNRPGTFQFILACSAITMLAGMTAHAQEIDMQQDHPYLGMWVTEDNHVRQELKPNGRYAEARGTRENAYTGRYEVEGNRIEYWDDTGFTADGEFIDGVLYHGGMVMRRVDGD